MRLLDMVLDLTDRFFSHPIGGTGRNVRIIGVDTSSSKKIDNRKKDIFIPGKGPTEGLEHTLSAEKVPVCILLKTKDFV